MGGGEGISKTNYESAYLLGSLIAREGWVLLNGGRSAGVMEASAKGAKEAGGLTVGILPDMDTGRVSRYIDIPIVTGMGAGRNNINVLSSDIVVALPGGAGTVSEIALALKNGKKVILLDFNVGNLLNYYCEQGLLLSAETVEDAVRIIKGNLAPLNK